LVGIGSLNGNLNIYSDTSETSDAEFGRLHRRQDGPPGEVVRSGPRSARPRGRFRFALGRQLSRQDRSPHRPGHGPRRNDRRGWSPDRNRRICEGCLGLDARRTRRNANADGRQSRWYRAVAPVASFFL